MLYYFLLRIALKIFSLKKIITFIERKKSLRKHHLSITEAKSILSSLHKKLPLMQNCLLGSLTGYALFKPYFKDLKFVLGVNNNESFQAHAWLEAGKEKVFDVNSESSSEFVLLI